MILAHPERVESLIVQDAVAHNEGLGEKWKTRRAFGLIARPTKELFVRICYRWLRRERDTSETIRMSNVTTLIFGRMSFTSSISPARLTFKAIYSTTIAPTSTPIPSGKPENRPTFSENL